MIPPCNKVSSSAKGLFVAKVDISLLFGINVAGGKVLMDPIVSEEASYEENELENRVVFLTCAVTLATKRP
jgi:hypothetical protein